MVIVLLLNRIKWKWVEANYCIIEKLNEKWHKMYLKKGVWIKTGYILILHNENEDKKLTKTAC